MIVALSKGSFTKDLSYLVMVNIYKAFILPHLEYCAPVLVGLSSGLSNKLELTDQYALRSLMNMSKSTSCSNLLLITRKY